MALELSAKTHVGDLLDSLQPDGKPEEEKRKLEMQETPLARLQDCLEVMLAYPYRSVEDKYEYALSLVDRKYSAETIVQLYIAASGNIRESTQETTRDLGLLISALMNTSDDTHFVLPDTSVAVSFLGYHNNGNNIIVEGNAGDLVACEMLSGTIEVHGDTGPAAGYEMKGGDLIIEGSSMFNLGDFMEGGSIHVKGDASFVGGHDPTGGIIRVDGDCSFNGPLHKSRYFGTLTVYHRDEKVIDNGEILK